MKYAIGIMSGTSVDAMDVALIEFTPQFLTVRVDAFVSQKFSPEMRAKILRNVNADSSSVVEIAELNVELSHLAAEGVSAVLQQAHKTSKDVICIGYHGQSLWHDPEFGTTLQIGDGPTLAALTGIPVINNFRTKDMAYGGHGAPLMPFAHKILFHKNPQEKLAVHNLGGISNPSYFSEKHNLAFDTGPCNILLDALAENFLHKPFDVAGQTASKGRVHNKIVEEFLQDPYFAAPPPKSTGREKFGTAHLEKWLSKAKTAHLSHADTLATATEFVVQSIAKAYVDFILPHGLERVVFCGGGVLNVFLLQRLQAVLPVKVESCETHGFEPQTVECVGFALLGFFAFEHKINQILGLTGSKVVSCLGQICYP